MLWGTKHNRVIKTRQLLIPFSQLQFQQERKEGGGGRELGSLSADDFLFVNEKDPLVFFSKTLVNIIIGGLLLSLLHPKRHFVFTKGNGHRMLLKAENKLVEIHLLDWSLTVQYPLGSLSRSSPNSWADLGFWKHHPPMGTIKTNCRLPLWTHSVK